MTLRAAAPRLALLPPFIAFAVEWAIGGMVRPHVWFLFYPALFISSWIGEWRAGVFATCLSTLLVWLFFIPPRYALEKPPHEIVAAVVFFLTGILFTFFHHRLRTTHDRLRRAIGERRLFAALIENSSDFIGIANADGVPVYVNPAGRQMVGLAADFPVEQTRISDYYTPAQRTFATNVILASMRSEGHWQGETSFRNWQTEQVIPVSDTHFIIRDPDTNQILGYGTVTRDISDVKRAREEIEVATRKLQQSNEEVTRLYEKTRELDEARTRFFAGISHEFRTPLALILGSVEQHLTSPAPLASELRHDLEVVQRNARIVLRHINDLLDVARLDAGHLTPDYSDVDAASLVRFVADHFSTLAAQRQVSFVVDAPAALAVQADAEKLQRMLLNLLSNAFKFTPDQGRVRVSLRDTGGRFLVEVGDSGPGIPAAKRAEVFDRFRRLESGAAERYGGTGLGLSIVKDFAAILGGTVSIADAPEGGALFLLDLPSAAPAGAMVRPSDRPRADNRVIEEFIAPLREADREARIAAADSGPRGGRVVVVEDNREMSAFIARTLKREGFDVTQAFDGREGYDRIVEQRPDLVLTDIMMPGMSGDDLIRALRQLAELRSMPIVVLTAKADDELRLRLVREGADDYLAKPFAPDELRARVRNLIARKRADDDIRRLYEQIDDVARASISVSEAIAGLPEASVHSVLRTIAAHARTLAVAEFAAVGIGGDADRPFDIWTPAGITEEQAALIGRPPRPVGLLGFVPHEGGSVRTRDMRTHPAYRGLPQHHPVMTSFLGVPIRYKGRVLGQLYLANKRGADEFTAQDERTVEMLAEHVGVVIETARLYAAEGTQRAWLQAVVQQMPQGVVLMDAAGRITVENSFVRSLASPAPPASDRFGNAMRLDLRSPTGERLSPDALPIVRAFVEGVAVQGREVVAPRADGQFVPLLVSAAPVRSASGALAGATMILEDVSALKELEHLREEWASIVVHELRQPINAIVLRSDLLLRDDLSDGQRRGVRQIREAGMRLAAMARDLMDASLLETRRMQMSLVPLDLGQLVRNIAERDPRIAERAKIHIAVDGPLFVNGDPQRLEQVVTNLLSNAMKYGAPATDIEIDVRACNGDVRVSVANRGPAIPADELPFLFARYVRLRSVRTSVTEGAGLGLYIAKGLVEAHGGRIWAESGADDVTTFRFTIPLDGRVPPSADPDVRPSPQALTEVRR